jgi:hypothetical protein
MGVKQRKSECLANLWFEQDSSQAVRSPNAPAVKPNHLRFYYIKCHDCGETQFDF